MANVGDFLLQLYDEPSESEHRPRVHAGGAAPAMNSPVAVSGDTPVTVTVADVVRPAGSYAPEPHAVGPRTSDERTTNALTLISTLATSGALSLPALIQDTGLAVTECLDAFTTAREAGLVELVGERGEERVHLTTSGRQVAHLMS